MISITPDVHRLTGKINDKSHPKGTVTVLFLLFSTALLVAPAFADPHVILQGGDVFIGEQGLDITAAVGAASQIAWFAPGRDPANDAPDDIQNIVNPAQFFVNPNVFVGETGTWYQWIGGEPGSEAFIVKDPSLDIKVWDSTAGKDVTGKSVVAGEHLNFRIDTNLYTIVQRPDSTGVTPMTLKVKTREGGIFSQLFRTTTTAIPLTNLGVNLSPWFWPMGNASSGWWQTDVLDSSGNRIYSNGPYSLWVECNANHMKDNYLAPNGETFTGKTVSATRTITISTDNVTIEASKDSVVRGNPFSVTVTGRPNSRYYLWVTRTSTMSGDHHDQPPMIAPDQDAVFLDPPPGPYEIGSYMFQGGAGNTVKGDVPPAPFNGTHYYASILLSNSGTRTVGWTTSSDTRPRPYTIRVEQNYNGTIRNAETNIEVEKGTVTIVAGGGQDFFPGEQIALSGTNSETDDIYLFVTGPGLPDTGGNLDDPQTPVVDGNPSTFTGAEVLEDSTWQFSWDTENESLVPGYYTIYAVATPNDKNHLDDTESATVTVRFLDTIPASITGLHSTAQSMHSITWAWNDPADLSQVMVFIDGVFGNNVSQGVRAYTANGLSPDSDHTISTRTVNRIGNVNLTWVNNTARTTNGSVTTVALGEGWNLFSTPVLLDQTADELSDIFPPEQAANIEAVLAYNGTWFIPDAGSRLLPLYALFVKTKGPVTATIIPSTGISSPPSRALPSGVSLIGPAPPFGNGEFEVMPLDQGLVSIGEVPGGLRGYVIVISPGMNQPGWAYAIGGQVRDLLPFKGYWVVMANPGSYSGFSTTPVS